jgi:hypothetical protein
MNMNEEAVMPRTARDALVTELLSDVGRLHDDIKAMPGILRISMSESLEIVAEAVEDSEKTAKQLQEATRLAIQATSSQLAFDAGVELTNSIQASLQRTFEPALERAASKIESLEVRLKTISNHARDAHATRFNYIVLCGFVVCTVLMVGAMAYLAVLAQENSDTNKWFYNEYKSQRTVIDSLPPDIKKRFDKK